MDRITHQSPRQRGYGSTSSLRNDSLKHMRKHEKGREESNQEAKHAGSGGPSVQEGWTVRTGHVDRPAYCRGLSAPTPRTVRPCATDRPKKLTEHQRRPRITDRPRGARGLSARHPRTVRPLLRTVRNLAQRKLKATTDRKRSRARTRRTQEELAPRGPSAVPTRTVRPLRTEQKTARPQRSTPPNHHRISQTVEALETRVWGLEKRHTRML
jgi:hypothetical protein